MKKKERKKKMQSTKTNQNRNEILLYLQKKLPFIEKKVLWETEKKCFDVAKTHVCKNDS